MGLLLDSVRGGGKRSYGSPLLRAALKRKSSSGGPLSLRDLQQQEQELSARNQLYGAPEIEEDKPGVFKNIIDVLSRPNYAIAGVAEELLGGEPSVTQGVTRALAEIFSGVGGIQGEKRAFGEVLERLGHGTTTLAEAFPALEGTWVGNFGSRGAAGLALDIATDPLTYITFGSATVGKKVFTEGGKKVVKYLNRAGLDVQGQVSKQVIDALGGAERAARRVAKHKYGVTDDFSILRSSSKIDDEINRRLQIALTDETTGKIADKFLDPGGVKMFGASLISAKRLEGFYAPVLTAAKSVPGGEQALAGARWFGDALKEGVNGIFGAHGALGNLPSGMREEAIKLQRNFMNASAAHRGRLFAASTDAERAYRQLEKANPEIGKKFYDVREGQLPRSALSAAEIPVYDRVMKLYDEMGRTLLAHGVLDKDQIRSGYMFHTYKNLEDLRAYHWNTEAPFSGKLSEQFTKERAFDSYSDAVLESKALNESHRRSISAGSNIRAYPVLEPEYDVFKNLARYIDMHSDSLARKAWREEIAAKFGVEIDALDINALYDVSRPLIAETSDEGKRIGSFFGDAKSWRQLEKEERTFFSARGPETRTVKKSVPAFSTMAGEATRPAGAPLPKGIVQVTHKILDTRPGQLAKDVGKIGEGDARLASNMRKFMGTLSDDGKREFLRQTVTRAKSHEQLVAIERELLDDFIDFFPRRLVQTVTDGEVDKSLAKTLGERAAEMIPVKAVWTGERGMHLPRAIWEDLQRGDSKLLNTSDYKTVGWMLRKFDWFNNRFKLGTYTFWPASFVRDSYSNIVLSMLDIGVQALNPAFARHAVGIMAKRDGAMVANNGVRYGYRELLQMAQDFGVYVPGEVFAELAGDTSTAGKFLKKAANYRGLMENEARLHLWLANIRRGATPRDSADHVARFLFNYGEVSAVEREAFRRFLPFYTFTRKNVVLQVRALTKTPGLAINQIKPFRQRDSEGEMMVKWEREGFGIRLDRDGKTVHAIQGIDLPLRNLDTLWAGGVGATGRRIMGMVTPLIKVPLEAITGRDFFTSGDMKRAYGPTLGRVLDSKHTPKGVKDWLGFKKEVDAAGRPTYTFDGVRYSMLVKSWMLSRMMSTSDRQFREYLTDQRWSAAALDFMTGLRSKELNLDEQQMRVLKRRIAQLEDSLVRRGVYDTYKRGYERKDRRGGEVSY